MSGKYSNPYRNNLADNSDIEALEAERQAQLNPTPEVIVEGAPSVDELPTPVTVEEETFKKRYADLRRHVANKEKEWKTKFDDLESKLEGVTKKTLELPSSDDTAEVENWMKEFPEVARIVSKIAEMQAEAKTKDIHKQLEEVQKDKQAVAREKAFIQLQAAHPDIDVLKQNEEFHDWVKEQPKYIQDALYNNETDWKAASRAIDLYKADLEKATPKRGRPRKDDIEASAPVTVKNRSDVESTSGKKMWKESDIAKMDRRAFDKHEDDIMAARREGRIVYDLSQKMASM